MTRIFVICACLFGLSACGGGTSVLLFGGSLASLTYTKKTLVDHAVSRYTEKNCSILHTARNEEYCQTPGLSEQEKVAYMASTMYCYRTLGGVSCYDRPDYVASSQTRIVFSDTLIKPLESPALASLSETPIQGGMLGGILGGAMLGGPAGAVIGGALGSTLGDIPPTEKY
jgi:hypothetical protein